MTNDERRTTNDQRRTTNDEAGPSQRPFAKARKWAMVVERRPRKRYWVRNTHPQGRVPLGQAPPGVESNPRSDKGQGNQGIACVIPETVLLVALPLR